MGLFDFFSKKQVGPVVNDLVWMSKSAKMSGLLKLLEEHPDAVLVCWFPDTETETKKFLESKGKNNTIKLAKNLLSMTISNKKVIFLEHYPLRSREQRLIESWQTKEVTVINSLDDPFFEKFGGDRIQGMMKQLGMEPDEIIQHSMISKSIVNAQEKIEKKVPVDSGADSVEEWFKKNLKEDRN